MNLINTKQNKCIINETRIYKINCKKYPISCIGETRNLDKRLHEYKKDFL